MKTTQESTTRKEEKEVERVTTKNTEMAENEVTVRMRTSGDNKENDKEENERGDEVMKFID